MKYPTTNQWIAAGVLAGVVVGFAFVSCSNADASVYVKAEIGTTIGNEVSTTFGDVEFTDQATYGAYVGTAVGPVRVEAGVSHLGGTIDAGFITLDASALDYNATAYLDTASGFYVGAGADYVQGEATVGPFSQDFSGYGWHVSGGYAFSAAGGIVEAQATYREIDLGGVDLSGPAVTVGYRRAL